jgi:hypothetical protein
MRRCLLFLLPGLRPGRSAAPALAPRPRRACDRDRRAAPGDGRALETGEATRAPACSQPWRRAGGVVASHIYSSAHTLLRWYRDLVRRRWTYPSRRPGRPFQARCEKRRMSRIGPVPSDKLTVPAHELRRRHEEGRPALTRQQPRERREHSAIGGGVPRTRHLATKDAELMAEYRDLDVLSSGVGPSRTRLSSLRTNRKVIGQPIPMIVADAWQCWSAAESRACTLQASNACRSFGTNNIVCSWRRWRTPNSSSRRTRFRG